MAYPEHEVCSGDTYRVVMRRFPQCMNGNGVLEPSDFRRLPRLLLWQSGRPHTFIPVRYYEDLAPGLVMWGDPVVADLEEMLDYARKNDPFPMHTDEEAAKDTVFGGLIASGGYTVTLWYRSGAAVIQGVAMVAGLEWRIRLPNPVRAGDTLRSRTEIVERELSGKPGRGKVFSKQLMLNQRDESVMDIEAVWLVATRAGR